ncbi:hypothetical protein BOX15_Mlig004676g2 [Macrostomum lignano]|uniref:Uncharacterized protein n=1 Tax=Macrostomum lignano TaxID=282301 RepID=A0A267GGL3_9PLAT|nr:hypothetical protein BOX15_Mlig004676g2 [Macrostomum lignano]
MAAASELSCCNTAMRRGVFVFQEKATETTTEARPTCTSSFDRKLREKPNINAASSYNCGAQSRCSNY